ncbi:HPP family-domain-containing protein [Podospora australis]|uniref:HPP family-domain-containing protein n=1 Tax=Podospora australis TaxID=1536484 RepID=A0AAN6WPD0_9PEZI|nr:HPP family-domain-containing protein [Podospora australis]
MSHPHRPPVSRTHSHPLQVSRSISVTRPDPKPGAGISTWHFDIDRYLNPVLPASTLPQLPHVVAHFLGYRAPSEGKPKPQLGNLPMVFWAAIGIFGSLSLIGAVGQEIPSFQNRGVPVIIGSFGAAAVLDFYAIESPLAQPRNAILGQLLSAITGVIMHKLFSLSSNFESVRWLGGALSCATATMVMALTGTVHPPAGATALMIVADEDVSRLGWFVLCPVLLGCGLMLVIALLVNNIQRRFPFYWWSPGQTGKVWSRRREKKSANTQGKTPAVSGRASEDAVLEKPGASATSGESSTDLESGGQADEDEDDRVVVIRRGEVIIPDGITLRPDEVLWLETVSQRL